MTTYNHFPSFRTSNPYTNNRWSMIRLYYWRTLPNSVWFEWGIGRGAWKKGLFELATLKYCFKLQRTKCKITNLNKYWIRKKEKSVMSKEKHFVFEDSGWKTDRNIFFYKKTLCTAAKTKRRKSHFNKSICTTDTRPTPGLVKLENHFRTHKTYFMSFEEWPNP